MEQIMLQGMHRRAPRSKILMYSFMASRLLVTRTFNGKKTKQNTGDRGEVLLSFRGF